MSKLTNCASVQGALARKREQGIMPATNWKSRVELLGESGVDPIRVVPYDQTWPAGFADWHARLSAVVPAATCIDHVGSTAVPGLPAKPTIDIQISVVDVEGEPAYVPGIESTGVLLRMREPVIGTSARQPVSPEPFKSMSVASAVSGRQITCCSGTTCGTIATTA